AEDGIRDFHVTGVQTCALPIYPPLIFRQILENFLKSRQLGLDFLSFLFRRRSPAIFGRKINHFCAVFPSHIFTPSCAQPFPGFWRRSEEHTSELQSRENLVCRL